MQKKIKIYVKGGIEEDWVPRASW